MAHIAEDKAWYSKIGAAVKERVQGPGKDDGGRVHPEQIGNVPDEPRQWRGFVFADDLEQGVGPGLVSPFVEPPAQGAPKEQRLVVLRAQDRLSYTLRDGDGQELLIAKSRADGLRFDFFRAPGAGAQNASTDGPEFSLVALDKARKQWTLSALRCERCQSLGKRQCGKRELVRIAQYVESLGEGQAFLMDVDFPTSTSADSTDAIVCESCGDPDAEWAMQLTARRPKWNPKHKSLTLDFHGRCNLASAKNFQLEDPTEPGKVKLLFGKVSEHRFALDYRYPLGMIQAFSAAVSVSHWT